MQKPKALSELISGSSKALSDLRQRLDARSTLLLQVRSALPTELATRVVSAGIDKGILTVGVRSAAWATRVRYQGAELLQEIARISGEPLDRLRVKVAVPGARP